MKERTGQSCIKNKNKRTCLFIYKLSNVIYLFVTKNAIYLLKGTIPN